MSPMADYKVQLDSYSGPMDLLLYLIRRDEVDIYDIPIARVLEQYLAYVRLLEELDPEAVGDFLVMAATLVEVKSRVLLPKPPAEVVEDDDLDPRADLVRQLLAYRSFREAADGLQERADVFGKRFGRPPTEIEDDGKREVDLDDVQIWDLMSAFNKLLASVGKQRTTHDVIYDDTPITLHAADVLDRLQREGPAIHFEIIFEGRTRGEMVGLFLALLELIRQKRVRIQQEQVFGQITVHLLDATPITTISSVSDEAGEADETELVVEDESAAADGQEEYEREEESSEERESVFVDYPDDDDDEEEDEYFKKISAVEIRDVDLKGTADPQADDEESEPMSEDDSEEGERS